MFIQKSLVAGLIVVTSILGASQVAMSQTYGSVVGSNAHLLQVVSVNMNRLRNNPEVTLQESKGLTIYVLSGSAETQMREQLGLNVEEGLDGKLLLINAQTATPTKGTFIALKVGTQSVYLPVTLIDDEIRYIRPVLSLGQNRSYVGVDYGQTNRLTDKSWSIGIYGGIGGVEEGQNDAYGAVQLRMRF